ncbi:hypothetical protein QUF80_07565 [Desulfococcaceae bacterium HSG8]|nr:hypothetical protein [Desulfococcaceae bacterium HSG8]
MAAPLIEAVEELKAENDNLKTRVEALKAIVCQDHPDAAICESADAL